jgi:ketosteroid isomerase-like protein
VGLTPEGDRVAVEAESHGITTSGKTYNNVYHFLFEMRGEQIQKLRVYPDTIHAQKVLVG